MRCGVRQRGRFVLGVSNPYVSWTRRLTSTRTVAWGLTPPPWPACRRDALYIGSTMHGLAGVMNGQCIGQSERWHLAEQNGCRNCDARRVHRRRRGVLYLPVPPVLGVCRHRLVAARHPETRAIEDFAARPHGASRWRASPFGGRHTNGLRGSAHRPHLLRKRKLCDRCPTSPMAPTFESQPDSPGRTSDAETKRPAIDAICAPLVHGQGRRDSNSTSGYCLAVVLSSGAGRPKRCRSKNAKE